MNDALLLLPLSAPMIYLVGPLIWRMLTPIPQDDGTAIELFANNRDQKVAKIRKLWLGGPPRDYNRRGWFKYTRPYRLHAHDRDGSTYVHEVAADGRDGLGHIRLQQRQGGAWLPVRQ